MMAFAAVIGMGLNVSCNILVSECIPHRSMIASVNHESI
jgi:hypothetical protein